MTNPSSKVDDLLIPTRAVNKKSGERYDIYIGRGSIWGNPFVIGRDGTRKEVISKYRDYLLSRPDLLALIPTLQGKVLGCFCKPSACHGDVLAALADGIDDGKSEPIVESRDAQWQQGTLI